MEWTKRKPKTRFKPGDRVKLSKEYINEYPGNFWHQESIEFYGKDDVLIVEDSFITPGGEIDDGDEGRWWGQETVFVYKIIDGKKHWIGRNRCDDEMWTTTKPGFGESMGAWCLTKV
jgi:hypothetical protein